MSQRLPWFRCNPGLLLGALAGMDPAEGSVYVTVLLRIYEVGGPVEETARSIHLRTHIGAAKVAAALARLIASGKLIRTESGRLDSLTTHAEIEWQRDRRDDQSRAGIASHQNRKGKNARRNPNIIAPAEKAQRNQRNGDAAAEQLFNHLDIEKDKKERVDASHLQHAGAGARWPDDAFVIWYDRYPHKIGKQAAFAVFERLRKAHMVAFETLIAGLDAYIRTKPPDRNWCNPATWLNQGRWDDQPSNLVTLNRGKTNGVGKARTVQDAARELHEQVLASLRDAEDHQPLRLLPARGSG